MLRRLRYCIPSASSSSLSCIPQIVSESSRDDLAALHASIPNPLLQLPSYYFLHFSMLFNHIRNPGAIGGMSVEVASGRNQRQRGRRLQGCCGQARPCIAAKDEIDIAGDPHIDLWVRLCGSRGCTSCCNPSSPLCHQR